MTKRWRRRGLLALQRNGATRRCWTFLSLIKSSPSPSSYPSSPSAPVDLLLVLQLIASIYLRFFSPAS
eukprot:6732366-Heterocapsa_arctica.AAC.1